MFSSLYTIRIRIAKANFFCAHQIMIHNSARELSGKHVRMQCFIHEYSTQFIYIFIIDATPE